MMLVLNVLGSSPFMLGFIGLGLVATAVYLVRWRMLDEYLETDSDQDLVMVRKVGSSLKRIPLGNREQVLHSVVVQHYATRGTDAYTLGLLKQDGKVWPLEFFRLPEQGDVKMPILSFDLAKEQGGVLAEALKLPCHHGEVGEVLKVSGASPDLEVKFEKGSELKALMELSLLAAVVIPVTYYVFTTFLVPPLE